jgi:hypothetical protein
MKSWEVYYRARKAIKSDLYEIYGNRSSRMIDYWAQDPAFSAEHKRNPVDRLGEMLVRLCRAGEHSAAKSALRILANGINCAVHDREEVVPDKETLYEEILDDMPCLIDYQRALQANDLEAVDQAKAALDREMAENRVRFVEEKMGGK